MSSMKPGELVLRTLLKQLTAVAKDKIEKALERKDEDSLVKTMQLSDDAAFEQLLDAFYVSAEFALPSILSALIQWYQSQHSSGTQYAAHRSHHCATVGRSVLDEISANRDRTVANLPSTNHSSGGRSEKASKPVSDTASSAKTLYMDSTESRVLAERRDLAIDMVFCQVVLSVLRQLPYHPGHNDRIELILEQCFRRFKYREDLQPQNSENVNLVADMYAEIVGLLSQTRFVLVRCRFMRHLNELRAKENSPNLKPSIMSLIMGMKFFRVKMHPIEDFVNCFTFLQELGQYFLEVKEPEIKHVLSDLFVEILLPVAAVARQEVNIPALKTFVENLYPTSLELANKKKHVPALFPLVTCLLCVGTKSFFLNNWTNFMTMCLSQLKNRSPKISLVSLQSLSCLLWVYIVRIRGEKHSDTQAKLHHIVNSLFPKSQKIVVPKDAPINIFVRIVQFIAHEKLEFAVKEIIIDRLGVNGLQKTIFMPERMNIGLCAFLLIAHGLQQRQGAPPMPQQSTGGAGVRQTVIKRSFHGTNLNDALGHILGIQNYLIPVRRAFEHILRQLDTQVCRTMMLPKQEVSQKEVEELMTAERKPKLDLLKTCVACIPRLLPNDMTKPELLELLAKVCLHVDEDVRKMAQQAMANLIVELPAFRVKTIQVFIQFIQKNVADTAPHQLDSCLKTLFHLLNNWTLALQKDGAVSPNITEKAALYEAEGFALVMLCHCRSVTRRLAVHILRKCRALLNLINAATCDPSVRQTRQCQELCCIDVLDRSVPVMIERVLPLIPASERHVFCATSTNLDFSVFTERCGPLWLGGFSQVSSYPSSIMPTSFISPQYSSLMPMNRDSNQGLNGTTGPANSGDTGDDGHFNSIFPRARHQDNTVDSGGPLASTGQNQSNKDLGAQTALGTDRVNDISVLRRPSQNQHQHPPQHAQQAYVVQPVQERTILTDVWGTCLSVAFSSEHLLTACPLAIKYAWSVLFQRLSLVFPLIDPSAQIAENRASSLLRTSSKKPTTERDQLIPLWHNYAVIGCCIAPSSTGSRVSQPRNEHYEPAPAKELLFKSSTEASPSHLGSSPSLITSSEQCEGGRSAVQSSNNNVTSSNLRPGHTVSSNNADAKLTPPPMTKENARDLAKLLVPLLRCEQSEIRDSAVAGLGRVNPAAFRDVLEEMLPLLKESVDRKQENVRRRRRRDGLRAALIRVLALMSQSGVFAYPESNALTAQGCLISQLTDYLDGMRVYLESVGDQATNPTGHILTAATNAGINNGAGVVTGPNQPINVSSGSGSANVGAPVVGSSYAGASVGSVPVSYTSGSSSTEGTLLVEIRLHLCIFVLELIRQLPKEKRAQLLPIPMRRQLFILMSNWSGYHDHVLGIYVEPEGYSTSIPSASSGYASASGSRPNGVSSTNDFSLANSNTTDLGQSASDSALSVNVGSSPTTPSVGTQSGFGANENNSGLAATVTTVAAGTPRNIVSTSKVECFSRLQPITAQDTWELQLWNDLVWTSNQAMGALVCCGPVYDQHALFAGYGDSAGITGGFEFSGSSSNEKQTASGTMSYTTSSSPSPGYILRWISGLLVARDPALNASPWLWFCPLVEGAMLHANLLPTGGFLSGASNIPVRATVAAGRRRLDSLLYQLGEETLVLLLDVNRNFPALLNWTIDQCYAAPNAAVSTACFTSVCRIIGNIPEFPCDFIPLMTLAFVFMKHPQKSLSDRAFYLLRVLYYRFVIKPLLLTHRRTHLVGDLNANPNSTEKDMTSAPSSPRSGLCGQLKVDVHFWDTLTRWTPTDVVRQLAAQHPEFTLPVFSELTGRLETARECLRSLLLELLTPWIINVELIDLIGTDPPEMSRSDFAEDLRSDSSEAEQDESFDRNPESDVPVDFDGDARGSSTKTTGVSGPAYNSCNKRTDQPFNLSRRNELKPRVSKYYRPRPGSLAVFDLPSNEIDSGSECGSPRCQTIVPTASLRSRMKKAGTVPLTGTANVDREVRPILSRNRTTSYQNRPNNFPEELPGVDIWSSVPPTLRTSGWGSKQATELVLNNLFYLTVRFAACSAASEALKNLWIMTVRHRPSNLRVILRYLIVITSIAPGTLLQHSKRLVTYLASERPQSVIEELMVEVQTIDGIGLTVERTRTMPFFKITTNVSNRSNTLVRPSRGFDGHIHSLPPESTGDECTQAAQYSSDIPPTQPLTSRSVMQIANLDSPGGQIEPELAALGLDTVLTEPPHKSRLRRLRNRASALPFLSSKRQSIGEDVTGLSRVPQSSSKLSPRPKSATAQPSKSNFTHQNTNVTEGGPTAAIPHSHSGLEPPRSPVRPAPKQSQMPEESDCESEIDVDAIETRVRGQINPEDKYATLRAKDFARLLSGADSNECIIGEMKSAPLSEDAQARSGTLPTTDSSRDRYFVADSSEKKGTARFDVDGQYSISSCCPKELKGTKTKTRSHPRPTDLGPNKFRIPAHSVSLPPSLAGLPPLPIPLPLCIPSMPSLWTPCTKGKENASGGSSPHLTVGSPTSPLDLRSSNLSGRVGAGDSTAIASPTSPQPLAMPLNGGYQAPLGNWLSEPLVIGGSVVYTGSWPLAGARSSLVLLLADDLTQYRGAYIDWTAHLPLMLLCTLLGMDHCRALIQEECKQLLVSLLNLACPEQDLLRSLRLELEARFLSVTYPSAFPGPRNPIYRLTLDGGPYQENFDRSIPPSVSVSAQLEGCTLKTTVGSPSGNDPIPPKKPQRHDLSACSPSTPVVEVTHTPTAELSPSTTETLATSPPRSNATGLLSSAGLSGSSFSLVSTATLIPGQDDATTKLLADPVVHTKYQFLQRGRSTSDSVQAKLDSPPPQTIKPKCPQTEPMGNKSTRHSIGSIREYPSKRKTLCGTRQPSDQSALQAAIDELRELLFSSVGQAMWTWDDFNPQRFQQNPHCYSSQHHVIDEIVSDSDGRRRCSSLEKLVRLVARILALSEAGSTGAESCLQCHHGPPHDHAASYIRHGQRHGTTTSSSVLPSYCMVARLSQIALTVGLSCPNRHYASRSLQIFRILGANLDTSSFSQLLARLGDTIADPNEELQGYVTELFLTHEAAIRHLQSKSDTLTRSFDLRTTKSMGQTRTAPTSPRSVCREVGDELNQPSIILSDRRRSQRHSTSASLCGSVLDWSAPSAVTSIVDIPLTISDHTPTSIHPKKPITRPGKLVTCRLTAEERVDLACGIFWTGVILLESDYEHEYIAGLRLLNMLVPSVGLAYATRTAPRQQQSAPNLYERAESMLRQMHSHTIFPGILKLTIKGCSSTNLVDSSCRLLVHLIPFLNCPLIVPPGRNKLNSQLSYPLVLLTLMPMLLTAWDEDPSTSSSPNSTSTEIVAEQPSFLQGGFLGRGVCTTTYPVPRALGSWASSSNYSHSGSAATVSCSQSYRSYRRDSTSFPSSCLTGEFGATISAGGSGLNLSNLGTPCLSKNVSSSPLRPKNPICIQAADALAQVAMQIDADGLSNLALVLRLYASGGFSKDVDQWAKCVVCYLLEGYSKYSSYLLQHLNTLLSTGPACMHLPLLKIACLLLEHMELVDSDVNGTLHQFITSVSSQFLGTEIWPEVIHLMQVIVSRSAVLSAAPPPSLYSLSGLDPSGSGRVLDFAAAAAAVAVPLPESEPPRMELAGPVLDFNFNMLSEAPLLAAQYAPSAFAPGTDEVNGLDTTSDKDGKKMNPHVNALALDGLFISAASSWNKSGTCQLRLRERIFNLINCYSLPGEVKIGAPRSPSVIFSQSTETLDPQMSVHSSSETTSMADVSNSDDIRLDETSSMEQAAVFRDLDTYLDAQLMNINFLGLPDGRLASTSASASEDEPRRPWGVRGQSITCHSDLIDDAADRLPTTKLSGSKQSGTSRSPTEPSWLHKHLNFPSTLSRTDHTDRRSISESNNLGSCEWNDRAHRYTKVPADSFETTFNELNVASGRKPDQFTPLKCRRRSAHGSSNGNSSSSSSPCLPTGSPSAADQFYLGVTETPSPMSHLMTVSMQDPIRSSPTVELARTSSGTDLKASLHRQAVLTSDPTSKLDFVEAEARNIEFEEICVEASLAQSRSSLALDSARFSSPPLIDNALHSDSNSFEAVHYGISSASSMPGLNRPDHEAGDERSKQVSAQARQSGRLPACRPSTLYSLQIRSAAPLKPSRKIKVNPNSTTCGQSRGSGTDSTTVSPSYLAGSAGPFSTTRSLSASNLLLESEQHPSKTTECRPPEKGSIEVVHKFWGRWGSPLLKFHQNFRNKRHSCSAEDLIKFSKPRVSFVVTRMNRSDSTQNGHSKLSDLSAYSSPQTPLLSSPCSSSSHTGVFGHSTLSPPSASAELCDQKASRNSVSPLATRSQTCSLIEESSDKREITQHSISVLQPWFYPTPVEDNWIELIQQCDSGSSEPSDLLLIRIISGLPKVFSDLTLRCLSCMRAASDLMSQNSWADLTEFQRVVNAGEFVVNNLRPPYFACRLGAEHQLSDSERDSVKSGLSDLVQSYEHVQNVMKRLAEDLPTYNFRVSLQSAVHLTVKLVDFLQTAHHISQDLYNNHSARSPSLPAEQELSALLHTALSHIPPSFSTYATRYGTGSPPAAGDECTVLEGLLRTLETDFRELAEQYTEQTQLPSPVLDHICSAVISYRDWARSKGSDTLPVIDCVIGLLDLYIHVVWEKALQCPETTFVYLVIPPMETVFRMDFLSACAHIRYQLHLMSKSDSCHHDS